MTDTDGLLLDFVVLGDRTVVWVVEIVAFVVEAVEFGGRTVEFGGTTVEFGGRTVEFGGRTVELGEPVARYVIGRLSTPTQKREKFWTKVALQKH